MKVVKDNFQFLEYSYSLCKQYLTKLLQPVCHVCRHPICTKKACYLSLVILKFFFIINKIND